MLDAILLVAFVALALFLVAAPERHFRGGSRRLRMLGAAGFLVAAAGALINLLLD